MGPLLIGSTFIDLRFGVEQSHYLRNIRRRTWRCTIGSHVAFGFGLQIAKKGQRKVLENLAAGV